VALQANDCLSNRGKIPKMLNKLLLSLKNLSPFVWVYSTIALLNWLIFFPGILSIDGIDVYEQALTGQFSDRSPILMTLILHFFMGLKLDLAGLTLIQSLLACWGIRFFLLNLLNYFYGQRFNQRQREWLSLGVFLILLCPLSPLLFYLMTFSKDSWTCFLFVWILALALHLQITRSETTEKVLFKKVALLFFLTAVVLHVRYNSIVVLPVLVVFVYWLCKRYEKKKQLKFFLPLVFFFLVFNLLPGFLFKIEKSHFSNLLMGPDLVGLLILHPELKKELPHTAQHMKENCVAITEEEFNQGRAGYVFGKEMCLRVEKPERQIVKKGYISFKEDKTLQAEYKKALFNFPLQMFDVKKKAFSAYLDKRMTWSTFDWEIKENKMGLEFNKFFERPRDRITVTWIRLVNINGVLWAFSYHHALWLYGNLLLLLFCLLYYLRNKNEKALTAMILLSLPMAYNLSYFLVLPDLTYRYMYPSTLLMQLVILSLVAAKFLQWRLKKS
jgi:hypothetical protein